MISRHATADVRGVDKWHPTTIRCPWSHSSASWNVYRKNRRFPSFGAPWWAVGSGLDANKPYYFNNLPLLAFLLKNNPKPHTVPCHVIGSALGGLATVLFHVHDAQQRRIFGSGRVEKLLDLSIIKEFIARQTCAALPKILLTCVRQNFRGESRHPIFFCFWWGRSPSCRWWHSTTVESLHYNLKSHEKAATNYRALSWNQRQERTRNLCIGTSDVRRGTDLRRCGRVRIYFLFLYFYFFPSH